MRMKKTIALVLAMMFALCAFVTAFADNETTTTTTATTAATETTTTATESTTNDDVNDLESTSTTTKKADDSTTTTTKKADDSTSTTEDKTVVPSGTAYEGQDQEGKTTTKKPANVDTTIPSTGSGIVVPAIALLALAAGTVAVIKTKKED